MKKILCIAKKILCIAAAVLVFLFPAAALAEEENQDTIESRLDEVLGSLDLEGMEELYREQMESGVDVFDGQDLTSVIRDISVNGLTDLSMENALSAIGSALKDTFLQSLPNIAQIILILVVMSVLKNLRAGFEEANVSKMAFFAGYVVICSLSASVLMQSVLTAKEALTSISSLIETLTPILMTLLTAMGGAVSSSILSPAMAALTGTMYILIEQVVFPAILIGAVIHLASGISTTLKLDKFGELVESGVKWFMGILFTVYLGISALKGLSGAALDGLSIRTAKYAIDHAVPVIGSMFSDTVDTLIACSLIVKNAIGSIGVLLIVGVIFTPIVTLIVNMFLFKLAGAIAEPFADKQSSALLTRMGNIMTLLFITLLVCGAMAFISIALLMGASNVNMMMR